MESMGSRALKRKYGTKEAAAMQQPKGRDSSLNLSDILKMAPSRTAQRASREMYFSERHPFNEPPSSTGSHATITSSSLASSATFSLGPDAESTRLDTYKTGRHRVQRSTGRFSRAGDILENVANTSALQRTFPEWHTNHTNLSTRDVEFDAASTMEDNKENQPPARGAKRAHGTELAIRSATRQQNRVGLRATVQNESDASTVLSKTPFEALIAPSPSPLTPIRQTPKSAAAVAAAVREQAQATTHSFIVPTSQSFPTLHALASGELKLTPGCKPTSLFYQSRRLSGPSHMQLPEDEAKIFVSLDKVREEVRSLQEHDEMLQKEADSLQQKVDGLRKEAHQLQAELDARDGGAYGLPLRKSTDSAIGSESDQSVNGRLYLEKQKFETQIISLRSRLESASQRLRDQAESLSAEREAATKMVASASDKSKKLQADLESARLQLDAADQDNKALEASSDEYYNEVIRLQSVHSKDERRIRELEQQVLQRDRVIHTLQNNNNSNNGKPSHSHRQEIQDLQEEVARLQAENNSLSMENTSLKKEKKLLRVQIDALVERDEFLEQEILSLRDTAEKAKTSSREHVEVQSSQFHRVSILLKEREQRLEQLEQGNQKLRQKQSDTEIQLGRAYEILHHWPGGLPEEYLDVLKKGRPMPTGPVLSQQDAAKTTQDAEAEDDTEEVPPSENPMDVDDSISVDENMTSAFIVPDITIDTNKEATATQTVPAPPAEDCQVVDTEVISVENDNESIRGGRTPSPVRGQRRKSATAQTSTARHVVFSEVTIERLASTMDAKGGSSSRAIPTLSQEARRVLNNLCEHRCDNCSICSRIKSHAKHGACTTTITTTTTTEGKNVKKMVRIPRPLPPSERIMDLTGEYAEEHTTRPARPPQEALARVLKGLEDEVEHLQMERSAKCNDYFRLDKAVGNRQCVAAEGHISYLSGMISMKRKQIYDLYDVLEGQKAAGQIMTQDEVDMTIASILHQGV